MKIATATQTERLEAALRQLKYARKVKAQAEADEDEAKATILEVMTKRRRKTYEAADGDDRFIRATVVRPEPKVVIDEKGLLNTVSTAELERITDRKLNRSKLEEEMDDDAFMAKAMPFLTSKESTPYIRFTEGVKKDDGEE